VCKLTFEQMIEPPVVLYGENIGSSYQRQVDTLSKHFRRRDQPDDSGIESVEPEPLPGLFEQFDG